MEKTDFLIGTRFKTNETSPFSYAFTRSEFSMCGELIEYFQNKDKGKRYLVRGLNDNTCTISVTGITQSHTEVLSFNKLLTINTSEKWEKA